MLLFIWANFSVYYESKDYVSSEVSTLPKTKVGLLLGTSRYLRNGNENPFFSFRIRAAVELYSKGKIRHILVSGDNSKKEYNEPEDMMNALIEAGVPQNKITLDFAGFDTYDSVLRANEIFQQKRFIVISQEFHAKRAVYIGRRYGLEVWGYTAKDVASSRSFLTHLREYFARVKAYVEVKLGVNPYFLGEKIEIE